MANHTIILTISEENLYQKYLAIIGKTDTKIMASLKKTLADQVLQSINEAGSEKFKALSIDEKIAFIV